MSPGTMAQIATSEFGARIRVVDFNIARRFSEALLYCVLDIYGIRLRTELPNSPIFEDVIVLANAIARSNERLRQHVDYQANVIYENFVNGDPENLGPGNLIPGLLCEDLMKYIYDNPGSRDPSGFVVFIAIALRTCFKMCSRSDRFDDLLTEVEDAITCGLMSSRSNCYIFVRELFNYAKTI